MDGSLNDAAGDRPAGGACQPGRLSPAAQVADKGLIAMRFGIHNAYWLRGAEAAESPGFAGTAAEAVERVGE